ncbi:ubiquitin-conjugating enzyme E2Q-like protein 1 [Chrysoperla carnea]|uniref:ubiquitin-conjugating enzyme E2Q-like protein 1 n=1 Tax=Chrysoperla carnea TaxID=189513 RepID=UPI001D063800|nr:ubiquitin-conjugating enzyme E2Q-like protein 1 [Chrysoperla carnea]
MTSRSKEKVAAAFRKLFRSSDKIGEAGSNNTSNNNNNNGNAQQAVGSPGRRHLLRGYRDAVSPADGSASLPSSPANPAATSIFKKNTTSRSVERDSTSTGSQSAGAAAAQKTVRARRLMKELREIQRIQSSRPDPVFTVELVNDNLFEWHVRLHRIDPESELANDMREMSIPHILLHLIFPENFPFAPPFMRVISPRIEKGFVMEGGAICMELLTPRGWASAYTVEAVLMQFAASIVKGQGRIARKVKGSKDFSRRSAEESFRSLVKTHEKYGWVTPALSDG